MPFIVILTMKDTFIEKLSPCQHLVKASPVARSEAAAIEEMQGKSKKKT
jgi:hypothetical protein